MATFDHPTIAVADQTSNTQERMLDSDEAAVLLKIHPKTLQRMARSGQVKGYRIGKLWRFRCVDLLENARH